MTMMKTQSEDRSDRWSWSGRILRVSSAEYRYVVCDYSIVYWIYLIPFFISVIVHYSISAHHDKFDSDFDATFNHNGSPIETPSTPHSNRWTLFRPSHHLPLIIIYDFRFSWKFLANNLPRNALLFSRILFDYTRSPYSDILSVEYNTNQLANFNSDAGSDSVIDPDFNASVYQVKENAFDSDNKNKRRQDARTIDSIHWLPPPLPPPPYPRLSTLLYIVFLQNSHPTFVKQPKNPACPCAT